jgi:hypothetical protein
MLWSLKTTLPPIGKYSLQLKTRTIREEITKNNRRNKRTNERREQGECRRNIHEVSACDAELCLTHALQHQRLAFISTICPLVTICKLLRIKRKFNISSTDDVDGFPNLKTKVHIADDDEELREVSAET